MEFQWKGWKGRAGLALIHCLVTLGAMTWPVSAHAVDIRIDFVAVIYGVDDLFCQCVPDDAVSPGDTLIGHYSFSSGAADTDPAPNRGLFIHTTAPYGIVVEHENYTFATNPSNVNFRIIVENDKDVFGEPWDNYDVWSYSNTPDPFYGTTLARILIGLVDDTGEALSSDDLPVAMSLDDWQPDPYSLQIWGSGSNWAIYATIISLVTQPTSVSPAPPRYLQRAYPNPSSSSVTVAYTLPRSSPVTMRIFDVRGRLLRTLIDGEVSPAGEHLVEWDGRNEAGAQVAAGVYFCALRVGHVREMRRIVLVR
jgi:hypothetical protein